MSMYPGTYTFTREQLRDLLEDVVDDVTQEYREAQQGQKKRLSAEQKQDIEVWVIAKALEALAFDATRPRPEVRHGG